MMRYISNLILLSFALFVLCMCSVSLAGPSRMVNAPVSGPPEATSVMPEEPSVVDPTTDESWWDTWIKEVRRLFHPAPLPSRWVNAPTSGTQKTAD